MAGVWGGNYFYVVDSASDVVTELAGGGTADRVIVIAMNYTLLDQFEILADEHWHRCQRHNVHVARQ